MELIRQPKTALDISTEQDLLEYEYTGDEPREVIVRAVIGSPTRPLSGAGGNYYLLMYIDDVKVVPDSETRIDAGRTRAIVSGRPIAIDTGETVRVAIIGLTGDVSVDVVTTLRDATPLREDAVFGTGGILVDHDYGGEDNLQLKVSGTCVTLQGALIQAYLRSDYAARRRGGAYVRGQTTTDVNGRWQNALMLQPEDYTLLISRSGYATTTVNLTVAEA
jgi:hypothetical protein